MLLRELFANVGSFSPITGGDPADHAQEIMSNNSRYEPDDDTSVLTKKDKRKTRLTLRQLNRLRRMRDLHRLEKTHDLETIRQMYGQQPDDQQAGGAGGGGGMGGMF